ncbi:hypothetical protein JI747_010575 [Chryseobacterium sp. RG1]|uniref:Uncharacterized protein n=1 Tax=Chryseobacterium tagetis TaxID=2801334 RepID=A0ABS8A2E3_9FLAO|nr:hypothetical protein [Chryseobacterium tagetis]MCA6067623.1 hypothetical protein [Chryseobacterium tagetis]
MRTLILPFLFLLTFIFSCRENTNDEILEKTVNSVDVYVAGKENNIACYWKNNVKINLANGTGITARKIIVENNDVYVLGSGDVAPSNFYLWKNNVKINIDQYIGVNSNTVNPSDYYHIIDDFLVDQGNIYLFGSVRSPTIAAAYTRELCYWKNGVKTVLFTEDSSFSSPYMTTRNFTMYNGDIYVPVNKKLTHFADSPNEVGYFKNNIYNTVSPYSDQKSFRHISRGSSGVYLSMYDNITNNTYYKNLINNTDSYISQTVKGKFNLDGNDIYDFSNGQNYFKNDINTPSMYASGFNTIEDLLALNQNVYHIRSRSISDNKDSYKVYINNTEILQVSAINGILTSIFVIQN